MYVVLWFAYPSHIWVHVLSVVEATDGTWVWANSRGDVNLEFVGAQSTAQVSTIREETSILLFSRFLVSLDRYFLAQNFEQIKIIAKIMLSQINSGISLNRIPVGWIWFGWAASQPYIIYTIIIGEALEYDLLWKCNLEMLRSSLSWIWHAVSLSSHGEGPHVFYIFDLCLPLKKWLKGKGLFRDFFELYLSNTPF